MYFLGGFRHRVKSSLKILKTGVSCSNYKYGSGISNLLKYFLIYLANQINRINMTSMDNIID